MSENKTQTIVEQLDAAQTGEEFGQVLMGLFDSLDRARDDGPPPLPFAPADPAVCTCIDPFSNCRTHG